MGYVAALALGLAAWGARVALVGVLPAQGFPFLTFFPAVMISAYAFGLGPGLACAALSVAVAYSSFMPHVAGGFLSLNKSDMIALIFFAAILLVDCVILHLLRTSRIAEAKTAQDFVELTNNSPDVLTRFDPHLRHLFVSGAIERITGRLATEFIGKTNRELGMPADLCDQWEAALASVFETGETESTRFEFGGKVFSSNLVPEIDQETGRVVSVLGVTRDITESDRQQRALEAQDRLKDQMVATVAHELRHPLATFHVAVSTLEKLSISEPAYVSSIAAMRRQIQGMSRLVADLMDLRRIRAEVVDLKLEGVDLADVLGSARETSMDLAQKRGIVLEIELPERRAMVHGDAGRLLQIFTNLMTNAIKFSPADSVVSTVLRWGAEIHSISIRDGGVGIDKSMLESVFEPFVQAPAGRANQSGLGIGLTLVKQLVKLHGGAVIAKSDGLGKGATFIVDLPALH